MAIYEFEGKRPAIGETSFVHPQATVIGEVTIGENCYIAAGAVLRGDMGPISVGDGTNIQEHCVLHGRVVVGSDNHITHGAIIHDATLGHNVSLGMGAIVMDGSEVGDDCIVGAGCLVLANSKIPPRKIVMGMPGKITGEATSEKAAYFLHGLRNYQTMPARYRKTFKQIG